MREVKKNTRQQKRPRQKGGPSASSAANGKKIKDFREAKGWKPAELAKRLNVHVVTVYAWERGEQKPSAETYISLANLASGREWKYAEWFLSMAKVERRTLQMLSDRQMQSGQAGPVEQEIAKIVDRLPSLAQRHSLIEIPSLEPSTEVVLFPRSLILNRASTRFFRVRSPEAKLCKKGDILLIDTLATDLRELREGSFVAISAEKNSDPQFGFVSKQPTGKNVDHYMFRRIEGGESIVLGTSTDSRAPELIRENLVRGRVCAWIEKPGETER